MANDPLNYIKDVLAAPLGELIASIGAGVAEAQAALDAGSLAQTLVIYSESEDEETEKKLRLFREAGYRPTFYFLPETEVEAQVSISISSQNVAARRPSAIPLLSAPQERMRMYAAPMNAGLTNTYNLNATASATLKFKIVPLPPGELSGVRAVPDLVGRSLQDAIALLDQLGLGYELADSVTTEPALTDLISGQSPEDGVLREGQAIVLSFPAPGPLPTNPA